MTPSPKMARASLCRLHLVTEKNILNYNTTTLEEAATSKDEKKNSRIFRCKKINTMKNVDFAMFDLLKRIQELYSHHIIFLCFSISCNNSKYFIHITSSTWNFAFKSISFDMKYELYMFFISYQFM